MKNTFYLIVLFVFFGCASPQTILTNLTKNSHSVAYLYESKKVEQKSAFSIYVDDISIDTLNNPMNAAVYKETGWFLPLLFLIFSHLLPDKIPCQKRENARLNIFCLHPDTFLLSPENTKLAVCLLPIHHLF